MDFEKLTLTIDDGVALLTLNDPDVLNAVSVQMIEELNKAIDLVEDPGSGARVLLITGAGRGFCAGANLADPKGGAASTAEGGERDAGIVLEKYYNPLFLKLSDLRVPVVSAVNGVAAGVGMSLALSADVVVAAKSSYFLQAFTRIGLVPDGGSTYILPRLIGSRRAMELSLLAEKLPAERALEWGLINYATEDGELMDKALDLARRLAKGPTVAYRLTRKLYWQSWETSYDKQLHAERIAQREAGQSDDSREGVIAFLQKRPADFKGK